MWRFLRTLIAFVIAFFLTMLIGGVLWVGVITVGFSLAGGKSKESKPLTDEGWLRMSLSGELKEYQEEPGINISLLSIAFGGTMKRPPTLEKIRKALKEAAENEKIKGIVLELGDFTAYPAQVQQLGRWLLEFKQRSKKPIYAYGDYFSELTYYLATYADTIVLYPRAGAFIEWNGLASENIFFRKFFDKWGVKPKVFRVGRYKSAAEDFTDEKFSEDNRQQITTLLEDVWNEWIDSIAKRRGIPSESLRVWPERYIFLPAEVAYANKMVDLLSPWHVWVKRFIPKDKDEPAFVEVSQLAQREEKKEKKDEQIAILYAEGGIGAEEDISAEKLVPVIQKIEKDEKVKAVVLRVNSPGGSVLDSDKITRALQSLKTKKPLVVSMGGVAASGGYYISALANKIVSEPTTITGSIGVIALFFELKELIEKHLELRTDRVKVGGKYADFPTSLREATPEEDAYLQGEINRIYEEFLSVVKEGRRYPSREAVHTIAQGRVWSGKDARDIGLVDTLGGLETAITLAAQAASLKEYSLKVYPEPENFFQRWLKNFDLIKTYFTFSLRKRSLPDAFQMYWIDEFRIF
ncbi:MAG: signal peptide peptidase SppA [Bacteroidia bacterium]|nr:signal peptide peptidase SppA [Bacteroidia bacterium]